MASQKIPDFNAVEGCELQPKDLKVITGMQQSNLKRLLREYESSILPPCRVEDNNGYRFYDRTIAKRLFLLKVLKDRAYRYTEKEIVKIITEFNLDDLLQLYIVSNKELLRFLRANGF